MKYKSRLKNKYQLVKHIKALFIFDEFYIFLLYEWNLFFLR